MAKRKPAPKPFARVNLDMEQYTKVANQTAADSIVRWADPAEVDREGQIMAGPFMRWITRQLARPWVRDRIVRYAMRRPYYPLINASGTPYMERGWLLPRWMLKPHHTRPNAWEPKSWVPLRPRIHIFSLPDEGQALHNHPGSFRTLILRGGYVEEFLRPSSSLTKPITAKKTISAGDGYIVSPNWFHRIDQVIPGTVSLFILDSYEPTMTGRPSWGFLVAGKLLSPREYERYCKLKGIPYHD